MPAPIPPPVPTPRRRTDLALPTVRYVPGASAHPGHGPTPTWHPGVPWSTDVPWQHAAELLTHRYLWEAHEAWEPLWRQLHPDAPLRSAVQGLIQLAAWRLKLQQGDPDTAERLRGRAHARLTAARAVFGATVRGVDLDAALASLHARDWPSIGDVPAPPRAVRVVAGAVVHDGQVFVARRAPHVKRGGLWELPGGKVEAHEDDRDALRRELDEELGLAVDVGPWLAECTHDYGDVTVHLVAYAATVTVPVPTRHLDHDVVAWSRADGLDAYTWAPADVPLLPAVRAWLSKFAPSDDTAG